MTRLTASIALCTYNGAAFLEEQLESIARQTRIPVEIVVRDDGSADATLAIVERFRERAPFAIKLIRDNVRLGYRANFMTTAAECSGDIIFFCDQDDIWQPNKIERMMRCFAENSEVLLAYHNATIIDAEGHGEDLLFDGAAQRAILARKPMHPWHFTLGFTQAFRRDLLAHQALWPMARDHNEDVVMAHDQWFIFLALALGRVAFADEPLVLHRQHGGNTYGVGSSTRWDRLRNRLAHEPERDRLNCKAAESRAQVLEAIADDPISAARLFPIAAAYRELAERLSRRQAVYAAPTLLARASAFRQAIAHGDYSGKAWAFKLTTVIRDAVLGVIAASGRAKA